MEDDITMTVLQQQNKIGIKREICHNYSMKFFLIVLTKILTGIICMNMAKKRHRRPKLWFVLGYLLDLVGVIILYFLPKAKIKLPPQATLIKPSKLWYYLDTENKQHGPMSDHALKQNLTDAKYVWNDDMEEWAEPEKVEELNLISSSL